MKIPVACVSFDKNLFGSERSLLALLQALDRERFEPFLVVAGEGPLAAAGRSQGLRVDLLPRLAGPFRFRLDKAAAAALELARLLRGRAAAVVHLNRLSFGHLAVVAAAARLAGCGCVVSVRMPGRRLSLSQKAVLLLADSVLSVTEDSIAPWRSGWMPGALLRRLHVVPSGRDIAGLKRVEKDRGLLAGLGVPAGVPVVGLVGALDANKRQDLFLASAEAVLTREPSAWFILVGGELDERSAAYRASLERILAGKPLAGRVVFAGYRQDALMLLKNFDALVLPSDREAFGGVLIEAMALGVPVVAHRTGGLPEVVEHGVNGLLVDEQRPAAYAAAVLRVLQEPGLADRLREAGRRAAERFDIRAVARRVEGLYAAAAGRGGRVAVISFDADLFGSERTMLDVLGQLDRSRFIPQLLLTRAGPLLDAARERGIETELAPWLAGPFAPGSLRTAACALRLAAWLRSRRARIVELNRLSFGHLALINVAARLAGCRSVVRIRMPGRKISRLKKLSLSRTDRIISVSDSSIAPWRVGAGFAALAGRVRVVPDSRDVLAIKALARDRSPLRALGVPDAAQVIGMVAALTANKRQDLFLAAAERVLDRFPDTWFVLVGGPLGADSSYAEELRRSAAAERLARRAVFAGYVKDALPLMSGLDALVLPSDQEAFGGVLVEAMALGVPIVAHRTGGIPEVIVHGETGLLVERQEAGLYAEALARVLAEPGLASRLRARGLAASERYDGRRVAREVEACYEEIL